MTRREFLEQYGEKLNLKDMDLSQHIFETPLGMFNPFGFVDDGLFCDGYLEGFYQGFLASRQLSFTGE